MKDFQKDVLNFWFDETKPSQWFEVNPAFDGKILERFLEPYTIAASGGLLDWTQSADGVLAYCILLDQMPRNMFRGTPKAFATDAQALKAAKQAVSKGLDKNIEVQKRRFVYLPFEHSEDINDQHRSVALFDAMKEDDATGYEYAVKHLEVIDQYGRFPHRNKILGRMNTPEEEKYLAQPNAGF